MPFSHPSIRAAVCLVCLLTIQVGNGFAQTVSPAQITLDRPEASVQLVVRLPDAAKTVGEGRLRDVTRQSRFRIEPADVATIDERGLVRPLADGQATLHVESDETGAPQTVPITVAGMTSPQPISFRNEVMPILTKARCNTGGCHGKAEGQN
jgi:hypothetical protein